MSDFDMCRSLNRQEQKLMHGGIFIRHLRIEIKLYFKDHILSGSRVFQ